MGVLARLQNVVNVCDEWHNKESFGSLRPAPEFDEENENAWHKDAVQRSDGGVRLATATKRVGGTDVGTAANS